MMKRQSILTIITVILILVSLHIGASSSFSWLKLFGGEPHALRLFFESRVPRTVAIILSAGALSLSGLVMQTVTQNRFAAPSTTGTVESAQLGMLLALFFFPQASLAQKMGFAFVGAMVGTFVFLTVIRHLPLKEKWMLPLVGILFGGMIGALGEMIAYRFNLVQSMASWRQGSFAMIQTQQYEWLFLTLFLFIGVWRFADSFTLMGLGQITSTSLGLSFKKMEGLALFLVALTTAVTMITVGNLPFLGVIVPNLVRLYQGDHLKRSQPWVVVTGICLVLFCDIFARLIIRPYEVSVSVVLGVIGSVLFITLLWRGRIYD